MKIAAAVLALVVSGVLFPSLQQSEAEQPTMPEVGKPAPTFSLNDQEGRKVSVGPNEDGLWTVLAFYPKAATPG